MTSPRSDGQTSPVCVPGGRGALLSSAGSTDMQDQLSDLQEMTALPEWSSPGHRTGYWRQTSPGGDALRQSGRG